MGLFYLRFKASIKYIFASLHLSLSKREWLVGELIFFINMNSEIPQNTLISLKCLNIELNLEICILTLKH